MEITVREKGLSNRGKALLEQTFIHIPGIGRKTERTLWERGVRSWQDYLQRRGRVFSSARDELVRECLKISVAQRENIRFFAENLPTRELWHLFPEFSRKTVYVDIETSGGHPDRDEITVIGAYDGSHVRTFVSGMNLEEFEIFISRFDVVVTFNGTCFDLPCIRHWFPHIALPPAHIDLRFLLKRLGYGGGLKRIEKQLGVRRNPTVEGLDGYDAVLLWNEHQWGDPDALARLIEYNTADIVNLKPLMETGYREMRTRTLGSGSCGTPCEGSLEDEST